ncbi:MAG: thioredoxin family protein [Tannerella sp.]|jgi:thiol-disulfide isomerase/thioredoxin|nr:thioredoxin family protein [Tannerella sp.]
MKPLKLFYLEHCPFCKKAFAFIEELKKQDRYKDIEIETIEESVYPEIANLYDYYYVPTFYMDGKKVHEGGIFKDEVKNLFEQALL